MKKLIPGVLLVLLVSCVEDSDIFIPTETSGPISELKFLIPSQSMLANLKADNPHVLSTDNNAIVTVPSNVLYGYTGEEYTINFIEMNSFQDFFLHNVDHFSERGAISSIYSFYVSIEAEAFINKLDTDKFIEVKFPYEKLSDEILVGIGDFESGNLSWQYDDVDLNNRLNYGTWEVNASDGSLKTENGYSVKVNKSGWYNVVSVPVDNYIYDDICLKYESNFSLENTSSYLISSDNNYVTTVRTNNSESNSICSFNIPFLSQTTYTIVVISTLDERFYFYKGIASVGDSVHNIILEQINQSELLYELEKL